MININIIGFIILSILAIAMLGFICFALAPTFHQVVDYIVGMIYNIKENIRPHDNEDN